MIFIAVVVAVGRLALLLRPGSTPPIDAGKSEDALAVLEQVPVDGTRQWVLIRTTNSRSPLVLFVHGGPGTSQLGLMRKNTEPLEKHFTVVNWDQRGGGKSFDAGADRSGWRGFALPLLSRRHSPLAATLLLAAIWAGWHAPLFIIVEGYRGFSPGSLIGFAFGLACGAIVLTQIFNRSGGSVLPAALWHTSYNMVSSTTAVRGVNAASVTTAIIVWRACSSSLNW